jgi:hypothetical protein
MAYLQFIIVILLAAFSSLCFAGYTQVVPPSSIVGATVKTGSASLSWINNAVRFNASLNVGGRSIVVPAAMRLAANAPSLIASAIVFNPYVRTAITIATLLQMAKVEWDDTNKTWVKKELAPGESILFADDPWNIVYVHQTAQAACQAYVDRWNAKNTQQAINYNLTPWVPVSVTAVLNGTTWSCIGTSGEYQGSTLFNPPSNLVPGNVEQKSPISNEEAISKISPLTLPDNLPNDLPPGIVIPLQPIPVINPSTDPLVNPVTRPIRSPVGEPLPVPNSDPQQWRTPVIDVVAAPLPDQPWRVDVQPRDIFKNDPSPVIASSVVNQEPAGQTNKDETPGLCDLYPDILACQKPNFDTPVADPIQTKEVPISVSPDSGWGADNAVCPAPRHLGGANVDINFDMFCQFMTGIRPIVISIAWMSAAMILIGFKRGE